MGHERSHAANHQNGGDDEISVAGLSGELADQQLPKAHANTHQNGGGDEMSVAGLSGELADDQPPKAHRSSHESLGSDPLRVDDLKEAEDNTDLDASTTRHGLLPKLSGVATQYLDGSGAWSTPSGGGAHASTHQNGGADEINVAGLSGELADNQPPKTHATSHQSGGGDAIKLDDLATPDDNTDLDASATRHGLLPKLSNVITEFLNGQGGWSVPAGGGGGLVTKAGTVTTDVNGDATVTFTTAFADTNYFIILTSEEQADTVTCMFKSKAVGGFDVRTEDDGGKDEGSVVVNWACGAYANP